LQAEGLAEIEAAVAVNGFFNVFDLIPVVQALPADDPRFAQVFPLLRDYISDPNTLSCVLSQPEICSDFGLAPRNVVGALMLFGDVFVKGGVLDPANVTLAETLYYPVASFAVSQTPALPLRRRARRACRPRQGGGTRRALCRRRSDQRSADQRRGTGSLRRLPLSLAPNAGGASPETVADRQRFRCFQRL
jgi:hypothetical protein